jgi:hypothetical protein
MSLQLTIGLNAISSYKRLSYTAWHAIAEFVDNSTQSFFDNKEQLTAIANPNERPLKVTVTYSRDKGILTVEDNAMGMSLDELQHAMQVASPPANTSGRSKYGMGLKTAASWMGDVWTIKTKKLGNDTEYTVVVNVEDIAKGHNELSLTEKKGQPLEKHYTILQITKMNQKFVGRTLKKISDYLRSMYREDFRSQILTLIWNGQILEWEEVDKGILMGRDGKPFWKDFHFTIIGHDAKEKNVSGWVGVLSEGSRAKAGFSILHSGRVVRGWPDAWRPESLFGDQWQGSNDLVNQRLVGEIWLDDFDVTHTKDDILWNDEEEEDVQRKLREVAGDYKEEARTFRKRANEQRGPSEIVVRKAVDKLQQELLSPELVDLVISDPMITEHMVEEVVEAVAKSVVNKIAATFQAQIGDNLRVKGYIDELSINDHYLTIDRSNPSEIIIIVNASHPHWTQLQGEAGVLNYLRHCTYDGVAEAQAQDKKSRNLKINPNTVRTLKDRLLRLPFEIEQSEGEEDEEDSL